MAEADVIPADVLEGMKRMGLFDRSIPEEYGGLDLSVEEEVLVALGSAVPRLPSGRCSRPMSALTARVRVGTIP